MSFHENLDNPENQGLNKRSFNDENESTENRNKLFKKSPEYHLLQQVQSQYGIGSVLILYRHVGENSQVVLNTSVKKIKSSITLYCSDESDSLAKHYQYKIDDMVIVEGFYNSLGEAKKKLSDLALAELEKVCFTLIKKVYPCDLPKMKFSSASKGRGSSVMGEVGKELVRQEQGPTNIVTPHFHALYPEFICSDLIQEVMEALKKYSTSQDYNLLALPSDFTKDERAAIHILAKRLGLKTKSYGLNEDRFLVVENNIQPWDVVCLLLECGKETAQYKLIVPTNFLL